MIYICGRSEVTLSVFPLRCFLSLLNTTNFFFSLHSLLLTLHHPFPPLSYACLSSSVFTIRQWIVGISVSLFFTPPFSPASLPTSHSSFISFPLSDFSASFVLPSRFSHWISFSLTLSSSHQTWTEKQNLAFKTQKPPKKTFKERAWNLTKKVLKDFLTYLVE